MFKKLLVGLFVGASLVSCKWSDEESENKKEMEPNAKDVVVGGDKDEDGCLASAGYTWSKLNKECIRVFTGIQLLPVDKVQNQEEDDAVYATYLLFDESKDNAELFLPNQDESIIVKRDGKSWTNGEWELVSNKGYQLKKAGKIEYVGDGQIGNKISGSDHSEDVAPGE